MSEIPYIRTNINGKTVKNPIMMLPFLSTDELISVKTSDATYMIKGTLLSGRGISSATCVAASVPTYAYLI
jgi:hypothetical protein